MFVEIPRAFLVINEADRAIIVIPGNEIDFTFERKKNLESDLVLFWRPIIGDITGHDDVVIRLRRHMEEPLDFPEQSLGFQRPCFAFAEMQVADVEDVDHRLLLPLMVLLH